jgi:hypothetical protein
LALVVVLAGVIFVNAEPNDGVTVEWVTAKDSFDANEEIMLKLVINNNSAEEKRFTYSVEIPEEVGINSDTPYSGVFSIGKGVSEELRYSKVIKSTPLPGGPGFNPSPNNPPAVMAAHRHPVLHSPRPPQRILPKIMWLPSFCGLRWVLQ